MTSFGGENSVSKSHVWLTPPYIVNALGRFDLDPCAALDQPWATASTHYTQTDNGLAQDWFGRVWLNPPYGPTMRQWLGRISQHPGGGVALIFARTETKVFFDFVWDKASCVLFLKGRLRFHRPDGTVAGSAGAPSVLVGYGTDEIEKLAACGLPGKIIQLKGKT